MLILAWFGTVRARTPKKFIGRHRSGHIGGNATKKKYGRDRYARIGKLGGKARGRKNTDPVSTCCDAPVTTHLALAYPDRTDEQRRGKINRYVCTRCNDGCGAKPISRISVT